MRTVKNIGIGLVILILLIVIISLFLPSKAHVERVSTIAGTPEVAFNQVNDLKNWEKWSPWHRKDPNMKINYSSTVTGEGAYYAWTSEKSDVGNGKLTISKSTPTNFIETQMDFMENGVATGTFKFEPAGTDSTKITWTMESEMGWNPISKFFGLMMDKFVGPDFEKGLHNLDSVIAVMPKTPVVNYQIETVTTTAKPCLTITDSAKMSDMGAIGKKYAEMYAEIGAYAQKSNLKWTDHPFAIMKTMNNGMYVWEAGAQTEKLGKTSGRIVAKNTYEGTAAFLKYYGAYEKTQPAYEAIYKWIGEQGKSPNGDAWEVYVSDPMMEKDTAKWETDIYVPMK